MNRNGLRLSKKLKAQNFNPELGELEARLGYRFRDSALLRQALTHSSLANELAAQSDAEGKRQDAPRDNEQLEFLGDSVLGFVTSDLLYQRFPGFREGDLSKLRAHLVSARYLLKVARWLALDQFVLLGKGEEQSGGRQKSAILTDAMEAILGAIYLDGGLAAARQLLMEKALEPELDRMTRESEVAEAGFAFTDYKSALQEFLQARGNPQPEYSVVAEEGPAHQRTFVVKVAAGETIAQGHGSTKKTAAQRAARIALEQLQQQENGK